MTCRPTMVRQWCLPEHLSSGASCRATFSARRTMVITATCFVLLLAAYPKAARGNSDCVDYASYSRWVASLTLNGAAQCVGVEGDLACVGELLFESGRLLTVDLSDLQAPAVLGQLETWETGMPTTIRFWRCWY